MSLVSPEQIAGRYELERRLGHGGMATVFLARDRRLGRPVAVKLLADNLAADEEIRERFMREARLAASLDHPNVVQVYDVGDEKGRPYIIMEHVAGGTLADRIARRRRGMTAAEALPLLRQMCEGLGHAHASGMVHRDVKPQNMLLRDSDDCLKVADFGIARAAAQTRITRTGAVVGTERYMAPEQLANGRISAATDVYSCGMVADELLPLRRSPKLHEIVETCLQVDPRKRFRDAGSLAEALAGIDLAGAVPATVPVSRVVARQAARATALTEHLPRPGRARERTATEAFPREGTATARISPRRKRVAAVTASVLVGALVAVAIALALRGDSDSAGGTGGAAAEQPPARAQPPPQLEDPADQARALADWLRARGR
jgi:hypothetical protein